METRFQYILLKRLFVFLLSFFSVCFLAVHSAYAQEDAENANKKSGKLRINSELFDIGIVAGVINIEDFPAEFVVGANITFKASEKFFLQYNYVEADISRSSFERNPAFTTFALDGDRSFKHYDLLLGYNVLQGEFFASENQAHLSTLHVVAGVGDTNFGGEENFTYTVGIGYEIEFYRRYLVRFDYRSYIYNTSLVVGDTEDTVNNTQTTIGLGYLF